MKKINAKSKFSELWQVAKLRMENEKLEGTVSEMENKYKGLVDDLGSAMADLNNVWIMVVQQPTAYTQF